MKFLGREITFVKSNGNGGADKIEPTNEQVVKQLQDAALADVKAFHRQMQQAQAAAAMIPAGAKAAKDLSQTKLGEGSALDALAQ